MMHHIDVHVRAIENARALFDELLLQLGYERAPDEPAWIGYAPIDGSRPRIGFVEDGDFVAGTTRIAFGVTDRGAVDRASRTARRGGAKNLKGPSLHPEYGDQYYAVFFEDADGNRFEIVAYDGGVEAAS